MIQIEIYLNCNTSLIKTTKGETFRQWIMLNIVYLDIKVCCKNVKMIAYRI